MRHLFKVIFLCSLFLLNCEQSEIAELHIEPGAAVYLAQARFNESKGEDGKKDSAPGTARLEIYTIHGNHWHQQIIEDPESSAFHKAGRFKPTAGQPGILSIGAPPTSLRLWRRDGDDWKSHPLYDTASGVDFGLDGDFDYFCDYEIADITGNGIEDIVLAAHDPGSIVVLAWENGTYRPEEVFSLETGSIHEIEVGDVDGDGSIELFATCIESTRGNLNIQPCSIDVFVVGEGRWKQRQVDHFETRHAREILCANLSGEDHPVLFTAIEGENDFITLRMYRFDGAQITPADIAEIPGRLCRFLTLGDTDGDGIRELIASTGKNGIWKITPPVDGKDSWSKELILTGTSGIQHATELYDFNGDGIDEIYVASDDQNQLRSYWHTGKEYTVSILGMLDIRSTTFNITAHRLEPNNLEASVEHDHH